MSVKTILTAVRVLVMTQMQQAASGSDVKVRRTTQCRSLLCHAEH